MPSIAVVIAAAYLVLLVMALAWNCLTAVVGFVRVRTARRPVAHEAAADNPRAVFTLVHGTWARRARWMEPDSDLRKAVAAVSGPARFERFVWSGSNSVRARQRAVRRLIDQLRRAFVEWPDAQHFIIAHSHGGNIALQSMSDDDVSRRVSGVVCLSTPFLTITPRQIGPVGRTVLWWVPIVIVFYGGIGLLRNLAPGASEAWEVLLLVVGIFAGLATYRAMPNAVDWLMNALQYPVVDPSKVLIIRTPADEASAALSATYLLSWFAGILWSGTTRLLEETVRTVDRGGEWVLRYRWWSLSLCLSCGAVVVYSIVMAPQLPPAVLVFVLLVPLTTVATVSRGGFVAFIVGRFFLAVVVTPMIVVIALVGMGVGPELVLAGLLFQVTAEAVPPGRWTVFQADIGHRPGAATEQHASHLLHSLSYQHPAALLILSRFIEERRDAAP